MLIDCTQVNCAVVQNAEDVLHAVLVMDAHDQLEIPVFASSQGRLMLDPDVYVLNVRKWDVIAHDVLDQDQDLKTNNSILNDLKTHLFLI